MAQATSYNSVGNREDLTDILTRVEPEKTPLLSSLSTGEKATNVYHEWQVDDLKAPSFAGVIDGQDVSNFDNKTANRARIGNRVQMFREAWSVSTMQVLSNPAGVSSDVAEAKSKAATELKRSMECALASDNDLQVGTGLVPSKLRALGDWIDSAGPADVPAAYRTPAASINATATASLAESDFNAVLQSAFEATGGRSTFDLYAGTSLKKAISNFTRATGAAGTTKTYQVTQDATSHQIDLMVDTYVGDFGTVNVIPTTFNGWDEGDTSIDDKARARGYLLPQGMVHLSYMQGIKSDEYEDQGGGPRGAIHAVLTLVAKNPKALGKFNATS